jgi:hypothetical protein
VLHGIVMDHTKDEPDVIESVTGMYQYLQQLVQYSQNLSLKGEIVVNIMELYVDIVNLCLADKEQPRYSYY